MFKLLSALKDRTESEKGPEEDIHTDPDAKVGDTRIYVRPMGEIFGYDSDHVVDQFMVSRQRYRSNATYHNGKKHYGWMEGRTIFRGTPEDWESVKSNPKNHFEDIPIQWDEIVDHVDAFLELHGDQLNVPEYPHGVLKLD